MPDGLERLEKMCHCLARRGPDSSGMVGYHDMTFLGHRRLAILDLSSRANQPMMDQFGQYSIVFNGEIVNFKDIRKALACDFRTTSDTEVIINAVREKGLNWLLERAIGMFAFVLYDHHNRGLIMARDQFGIKPLYYALTGAFLVVASSPEAILRSGLLQAELNPYAVDDYFAYRYALENHTFFKGISQVAAGHYYSISSEGDFQDVQYYELPRLNQFSRVKESEVTDELEDIIRKVIRRWLISDVPVGTFLSGGVDSSLLTALAAEKINQVQTYTIGFNDRVTNEFEYSDLVAKQYGTRHHKIVIDIDRYLNFDLWDELTGFKGAPLGVPNEVPLAIMSKELSEDVTIVLSGEGADELFGGYGRIYQSPFDFINREERGSFFDYFINCYEYLPRKFRNDFLMGEPHEYRNHRDEQQRDEFNKHSNEENVFRFFLKTHLKGLLQRLDNSTMFASVESRPPFLDKELVEFVFTRIPLNMKIQWKSVDDRKSAMSMLAGQYSEKLDIPKYILKKVSERYLPKSIIYRPKLGFPIPLSENQNFLIKECESLRYDSLWLRPEKSKDLLRELSGGGSGLAIWMVLSMERFIGYFFKKNWLY